MPFHPGDLPKNVQYLFNKHIHSPILWPIVVKEAIKTGIKDSATGAKIDNDTLADIVFYMHHPDLIGTPLTPGVANYQKLVEEWKGWKNFVRPMMAEHSKPDGPEEWKPYKDSVFSKTKWLPDEAKKWLAKPPTTEREVGIFKSNKRDGPRKLYFFAWKTSNTDEHCKFQGINYAGEALHGWYERETTLTTIAAKHELKNDWITVLGNNTGAKMISALNYGMNIMMFHYVAKQGRCIDWARNQAKRDLNEEGKLLLKFVGLVVGGASGAKSGVVKPVKSNEALLRLSKLNLKGFAKQLHKVHKGTYETSPSVRYGHHSFSVDKEIRGSGGDIVGWTKSFP